MMKPTLREILATNRYDTDKSEEYLASYERCFADFRTAPTTLLEVGIHTGGSLLMWRDYFLQASIVGVDRSTPVELCDQSGRIRVFQCDQVDAQRLDAIARESSPTGFHVIIDDASHLASLTAITFRTLFYKHLRPGGFYAIEDWGTGYWDCWPDGSLPERLSDEPTFESQGKQFPSHQSGMVGL